MGDLGGKIFDTMIVNADPLELHTGSPTFDIQNFWDPAHQIDPDAPAAREKIDYDAIYRREDTLAASDEEKNRIAQRIGVVKVPPPASAAKLGV